MLEKTHRTGESISGKMWADLQKIKVAQKLNEIPNACKEEDILYFQILCKEGAEADCSAWKGKTKWKFGQPESSKKVQSN